ncbi:Os11g0297650 [Oryza sativa Japonica Group]|uniref:Os11g0297650 protein n=1 Tax=Oryza sativa subsp. japonica TaxID=39947 RepID=A0A0P0Y1D8_ORYSJ|nr:hypothetical protein EE612_054903 [Oryza sativa]BAT13668.1 Os11g0297650 [Oryza sativa Japonica Group]
MLMRRAWRARAPSSTGPATHNGRGGGAAAPSDRRCGPGKARTVADTNVRTWPMRNQRSSSKAAAVRRTWGKLVAARAAEPGASKWSPLPEVASPWSASDHHLYAGTPSRGTPAAWSPSCATFSAAVSLATRSAARCSAGSVASQNAYPCPPPAAAPPHENGGSPPATTPPNIAITTTTITTMPPAPWQHEKAAAAMVSPPPTTAMCVAAARVFRQTWRARGRA